MKIRLQNIGIVKDSTLCVDGLTVITGKNNSGKTTVGKTLYALIDAVSNLKVKAQNDRSQYIRHQLSKVEDTLDFLRYAYMSIQQKEERPAFLDDAPALRMILDFDNFYRVLFREKPYSLELAQRLAQELEKLDSSSIEGDVKPFARVQTRLASESLDNTVSPSAFIDKRRDQALAILNKLFEDLETDPGLVNYARESVNQTLRMEFAGQIQPVRHPEVVSRIEVWDQETACFQMTIADNVVVNEDKPVFNDSPYKKAYMIDDPMILDNLTVHRPINLRKLMPEADTLLDSGRILPHNDKLRSRIHDLLTDAPSIFERTVLDQSLADIKKEIDHVLDGSFESSSDGEYYVRNGVKLRVSNLATGSKMFSIIKILLDRGELDDTTMLILDEPEAHLHPKWQNIFAEIIVLLVKELHVNILLTTHSPNFMLALDAFMRRHRIVDRTNFYQTSEPDEEGFISYHCANDNMERIYQDFLEYLLDVKNLRNIYLHGDKE